jgi:hypothetical protein
MNMSMVDRSQKHKTGTETSSTGTETSSTGTEHSREKMDCIICMGEGEVFIQCPFCEFKSCMKCVETFLMGIEEDKPRCMNNDCRKVWSYEFLSENFHKSFYNKKYRDRRAVILHEKEKALLPGTQHLVEEKNRLTLINKQRRELMDERNMFKTFLNVNKKLILDTKCVDTRNEIERENMVFRMHHRLIQPKINALAFQRAGINMVNGKEVTEKVRKSFTRACPIEECRGFISTGLKCGICGIKTCKDCHLQKEDDHKCDPDLVATVLLLANDTKPCPACATPIFKIHGCDQMYCTQCHTAFSWAKGTIERGVIHNPHYYAAQRAMNGGIAPRVAGDVRCGGVPSIHEVHRALALNNVLFAESSNVHMLIGHINLMITHHYPVLVGDADNSSLRVDYLMNLISEKQWVSKIKCKVKKQEKNTEFNMVLSMFTQTLSDIFCNIVDGREEHDVTNNIVAISTLRDYTNKSLKKIGIRYENVYPIITDDFKFQASNKVPIPPSLFGFIE